MGEKELQAILTLKDQLSPKLKGIQGQLKIFGNELKRLAKIGFVALSAAAAAVSAAFVKLVKDTLAYGVQLDKIAKQTGVTTEQMSKLQYAAEQEHASVESITKSMPILAKYMEYARQGMKTYSREFDKMGISVVNAQGKLKSTYEVLLEMADYYSTATNKTEALAIATTLLGRRGAELVPLLQLGRQGIEELGAEAEQLGIVLDNKTAAGMKVFDDKVTKLKGAFRGIGIAITEALLPYLVTLSDELGKLDFSKIHTESQKATKSVIEFGAFIVKWAFGIKLVGQVIALIFKEIQRIISIFVSAFKQSFLSLKIKIQEILSDLLSKIKNFVDKAGPFLKRMGIIVADNFSEKIKQGIDELTLSVEESRKELGLEEQHLVDLANDASNIKDEMYETAKAIYETDKKYSKFTQEVKENGKALMEQTKAVQQANEVIAQTPEKMKWITEQGGEMYGVIKSWAEGVEGIGKSVGSAITAALDGISSGTAKAFRDMLETGKNFGESMKDLFRNIMFDIVEQILQSQIKSALASIFSVGGLGGGGGLMGGIFSFIGSLFGHQGGWATMDGIKRFHSGGMPGSPLRNDEVPAILQTGERVLNRQEAREYSQGDRRQNIYNISINAVDAQSFAMMVKRNPESIVAVVGENMARNGSLRSISRATA